MIPLNHLLEERAKRILAQVRVVEWIEKGKGVENPNDAITKDLVVMLKRHYLVDTGVDTDRFDADLAKSTQGTFLFGLSIGLVIGAGFILTLNALLN